MMALSTSLASRKKRRNGRGPRPAVTLPVEIYSEKRIRQFNAAEAELGKVLRRKTKRAR